MRKERKHYTAEEKVAVLRRHLLDKVPVSDLCEELSLKPTVFYRWQKEFFENGAAAFQSTERPHRQVEEKQKRIDYLEKKVQTKNEGLAVGPTKRGKGTKIMAIAAVTSLPLAVTVDSASPHETKLVEETLAGSFLDELPARLIGDRAYDSDSLDRRLERDYGIDLIAPNRENRSQTQDGRKLRRYKRRWCVERLFAWLQWFRRLVTRYEYHIENFLGMVRLGCMRIMLRYL